MSERPVSGVPQPRGVVRATGWYRVERAVAERFGDELTPTALGIYHALLSHMNAERRCWPSQRRLARLSRYSLSSVIRGVRILKKLGLISYVTVHEEGKRPFNVYTILQLDELAPVMPIRPGSPHRLPTDWTPSAEDLAWAHEQGFEDDEIERAARKLVHTYTATEHAAYLLTAAHWSNEWRMLVRYP